MTRRLAIINRLVEVVRILGDLADEFVFVGGSVVPILVTDEAAQDARLTIDVDVIVHVLQRSGYYAIQDRLAKVDFRPTMQDPVICRFKHGELTLDVMPTDESILTFGNRWYPQAMSDPIIYPLLPERSLKVIAAPLFLCTKFDAYKRRGAEDKKDLEDIIAVVDGRPELMDELKLATSEVKKFLSDSTQSVLQEGLLERLDWFLPGDEAGAARITLVRDCLQTIVESA